GLRLGYLVLPPDLVAPFLRAKQLIDRNTASLDQAVLAQLIRDGHFERHIRRSRRATAGRSPRSPYHRHVALRDTSPRI
ncbi:hypothetical protein J8J17_26775, partial [Mycobacterium tuberculosis]|nr:hypothetical protein [Mycobacterium tuberculosis]